MYSTPTGSRFPQTYEGYCIATAAKAFARYLTSKALNEDFDGPVMRCSGVFSKYSAKSQLIALRIAISSYFSKRQNYAMTQLSNSALECVFSWLFYEIKVELALLALNKSSVATPLLQRPFSHAAYQAWEHSCTNSIGFNLKNATIVEWAKLVDSIAARSVFLKEALTSAPDGIALFSEESFLEAISYFDNLDYYDEYTI